MIPFNVTAFMVVFATIICMAIFYIGAVVYLLHGWWVMRVAGALVAMLSIATIGGLLIP